jgi:hypothetical protein
LDTHKDLKLNRNVVLAALSSVFFFLSLCAWSLSGPLTSGYDSTFHLSNIWCAQGEKPGICEDYSTVNGKTYGNVPAELASSPQTPEYFRAELSDPSRKSPFYSIMNFLVTENTTQSVLLIRLFNTFISSFMFFALLFFATQKAKVAVLSSWTFTVSPIIIATLWQPNPRSWGYLSVMSSWAFLYIALNNEGFSKVKKTCLWLVFCFSLLLAFTSRVDATLFCVFTCGVVLLVSLLKNGSLKPKTVGIATAVSLTAFLVLRLMSSSIQWYTQFSFSAVFGSRQTLFVLIHLPENIADSLGLGLRYPDLGPNSIGIIGVVLFGIAISSWLREGNAFQIAATFAVFGFMLLSMFQIAFYWPEANEASGVYIAALLTVCLGIASVYSMSENYFPNTNNQRFLAILLVSVCHALTLYSKFDWSVRANVTNDTYTQLSLNGGWWWDASIGPNVVFLIGSFAFPAWLVFSWATILEKPKKITA